MNKFLLLLILICQKVDAIDWQGHRGARGLYPENSITAMKGALSYPITTLELDVVISMDHKVIVSHEPWMNPEICKSEKLNLYKLKAEEIVKYDCGSKGHPAFPQQKKIFSGKPLLSTLINEVKSAKVNFNVEIKSSVSAEKKGEQPEYQVFSDLVVKELKEQLETSRFTIQSFDWRVLKYLHEKYPEIGLVALKEGSYSPEEVIKELGFHPAVFSPYYKNLTASHVEWFHQKKIKVIPWTVNTASEMRSLLAIGVDGIITDYPNLIPEATQKACPEKHNFFEDRCVRVPRHGVPSKSNPGWECRPGFMQKRSKCIKISIPEHATLSEDGKTWICNEGYERYRATCKKK